MVEGDTLGVTMEVMMVEIMISLILTTMIIKLLKVQMKSIMIQVIEILRLIILNKKKVGFITNIMVNIIIKSKKNLQLNLLKKKLNETLHFINKKRNQYKTLSMCMIEKVSHRRIKNFNKSSRIPFKAKVSQINLIQLTNQKILTSPIRIILHLFPVMHKTSHLLITF